MSRLLLFCLSIVLLLITESTEMNGQDRSYDQNALRLDSKFGDMRILRGVDGTVVGKVGVFRGMDVAKIVAPSETAVAEAREFERNYAPGNWLVGLGLMTFGASLGASRIPDLNPGIGIGLSVASFALIGYGGLKLQHAYNALHRALWWYNRDLK